MVSAEAPASSFVPKRKSITSSRFDLSFLDKSPMASSAGAVEINQELSSLRPKRRSVANLTKSLHIPLDQMQFNEAFLKQKGGHMDWLGTDEEEGAGRKSLVEKRKSFTGVPIMGMPMPPGGVPAKNAPPPSAAFMSPSTVLPERSRRMSLIRSRHLSVTHGATLETLLADDALAESHVDRAVIPRGRRDRKKVGRPAFAGGEATVMDPLLASLTPSQQLGMSAEEWPKEALQVAEDRPKEALQVAEDRPKDVGDEIAVNKDKYVVMAVEEEEEDRENAQPSSVSSVVATQTLGGAISSSLLSMLGVQQKEAYDEEVSKSCMLRESYRPNI